MTFTIFFVTTSYQSLKLVTLTYNEVTVTNLRIHYTVVIEKLVNVTKQCSDVHYIVFTVYHADTQYSKIVCSRDGGEAGWTGIDQTKRKSINSKQRHAQPKLEKPEVNEHPRRRGRRHPRMNNHLGCISAGRIPTLYSRSIYFSYD